MSLGFLGTMKLFETKKIEFFQQIRFLMFSVQKSNFRVSGATLRVRFWHCMIIEKLAPEYFQHFAHFNVQRGADLGCSRFVVFQVT